MPFLTTSGKQCRLKGSVSLQRGVCKKMKTRDLSRSISDGLGVLHLKCNKENIIGSDLGACLCRDVSESESERIKCIVLKQETFLLVMRKTKNQSPFEVKDCISSWETM